MNRLVLNGMVFGEPLPDTWSLWDLVVALESHVLSTGELIVAVAADGRALDVRSDAPGPTLGSVSTVEIEARPMSLVVEDGVRAAATALDTSRQELRRAVDGFRAGFDRDAWTDYGAALAHLGTFVGYVGRLANIAEAGLVPGFEVGAGLARVEAELAPYLRELEGAAVSGDTHALADRIAEVLPWLAGMGASLGVEYAPTTGLSLA